MRARGLARSSAWGGVLTLAVLCAGVADTRAQAWVPPAGVGVIGATYQSIDNTSHRLTDGSKLDGYDSVSRGVLLSVDYAVTDRFSFSLAIPYVGAKYLGPEPSFFDLPIDECRCWNHGWQDFGATARYNLVNGAFALTPSVSVGLPSSDYEYFGEAVLGRNLKEVRLAVDAGQRLDVISPRLSLSGRYTYAIVQRVLDLPNNRSNISLSPAVLMSRRLSARGVLAWQRSHGGLRSDEFETDEQWEQFDRLLRDNYFHLTGGVSYSFPAADVFVSFTHYVSGTDTHAGRALTVGMSWPFFTR
jgi:hypothetical protein